VDRYTTTVSRRGKINRFLCLLLIGGFLCGAILTRWINPNDIKDFSSYFVNVNMSDVEQQDFFFRQFFLSLAILFMIFFSSFSLLGVLKVSFLTFTKGVQIGFSCLLFLYTYEFKGILGILMVLIPQVVLDVLYISILSYGAIDYSYHLLLYYLRPKSEISFSDLLNQLLTCLLVSALFSFVLTILKSTIFIYFIRLFHML